MQPIRDSTALSASSDIVAIIAQVPVLCARALATRCAELLVQPPQGLGAGSDAALPLARLLAHLLLVVDFHVVLDVMWAAESAALLAPASTQRDICGTMYKVGSWYECPSYIVMLLSAFPCCCCLAA